MKKNQKIGIISIAAGVLIVITLFLTALSVKVSIPMFGSNSESYSFFETIKEMKDADETLFSLTAIFTIISCVVSACLMIFGALCLAKEQIMKFSKIALISTGAVAALTALFAIMFAITYSEETLGIKATAGIGFGSIILLVLGAATIALPFFVKSNE